MISPIDPPLRRLRRALLAAYLLAAPFATAARTQPSAPPSASITGVVTDPSGAVIPNATVTLHPTSSAAAPDIIVFTSEIGRYTLLGPAGIPSLLVVTAPGFATFTSSTLRLAADRPRTLDVRLRIATNAEQVSVTDSTGLDTDPNRNGDSLVLTGKAIQDLPLDSNELLLELQGLSGGLSPDLYVDGFSGQSLPPRDTIREIRINQNPYSAVNDTSPGNGRIEVFTKPGSGTLHGDFFVLGDDKSFNSSNPFVANQPPYYYDNVSADLNGPLSKHVSVDLEANRQSLQTNALIEAQALDAGNNVITVSQAVPAPTVNIGFSPRLDVAAGKKNTLSFRYGYNSSDQTNGGIGQLALATQGFANHNVAQFIRASNAFMLSEKIVNDTRFIYTRSRVRQTPTLVAPTISVAGAFTGGGNSGGAYNDNQDRFELQNYVSQSAGKHFLTYGGRFRSTHDANHSTANYQGTYTFTSLALNPTTCATPTLTTCNSYQVTLQNPALTGPALIAAGGGESQFSITQGNPNVTVMVADGALFFQDDWKARPNLTLSSGLRFETQNHIADHADYAPRLGVAWSLRTRKDKPPVYILRGGAGLFYARFTSGYVLQAERQNGITQRQYILSGQGCYPNCNTPANLAGAQSQSTIYQISPTFHSPYFFSGTASIQRQINTWGNVTLTYLFGREVHGQLTRNINAPLPGTYNPAVPTSGTRPLGGNQNIYEYDSQATDRTHRLTANFFFRLKDRYLLYGYYQYRHNLSDSNGGFPSNQYNLATDYGRSDSDFTHSGYLGASVQLPLHIEAFTFVRTQSGTPFNITVGQDLNGDGIFNDRPAFATDLTRPSVVKTQYGAFDTRPIAGQTIIPNNYGHGPGLFLVNLNLNRDFHFGPPAKAVAGQKASTTGRYTINVGVEAQNLFNQVNLANPIGTLNSPLFGRSIALAPGSASAYANRTIQLDAYFEF